MGLTLALFSPLTYHIQEAEEESQKPKQPAAPTATELKDRVLAREVSCRFFGYPKIYRPGKLTRIPF